MNVAEPISSVIPSLDGPVYAALAGSSAPQTLSAVHRRTGRSIEGVRRVLQRMVATGLVLGVPGGYVLNRDHLAAPAIEELCGLSGLLLERIRTAVAEWGGGVDLVGLFGSAARRDGDEGSDIDVLVVSDAPDLDDFVDSLATAVHRWTGNRAQVVGRPRAEMRRLVLAGEPIVDRWGEDLLVVCGSRRALAGAA